MFMEKGHKYYCLAIYTNGDEHEPLFDGRRIQ